MNLVFHNRIMFMRVLLLTTATALFGFTAGVPDLQQARDRQDRPVLDKLVADFKAEADRQPNDAAAQYRYALAESYADARGGEIWLINSNIPEYLQANRFNHAPKRPRKLLLHRRPLNKLIGAVEREGLTLIPLKLYFNEKGRAKLELALARGKKLHDKRETEKKRSWQRERGRLLRQKG